MPSGFSLYSVRRSTTRRGKGAVAARAREGTSSARPIKIANVVVTLMKGSSWDHRLGRTLFRFDLLPRHLEGQEGALGSLLIPGPQGLELRERLLLPGRVAQGLLGAGELVVRDRVLRVERDRLAQVGERRLGLPTRDEHAAQGGLGLLEVGIVVDRGLEEPARLVEVPRPPVRLPELVGRAGARGVEGELLRELLQRLCPGGGAPPFLPRGLGPRQEGAADPEVDAGPPRLTCEHRTRHPQRRVVRPL